MPASLRTHGLLLLGASLVTVGLVASNRDLLTGSVQEQNTSDLRVLATKPSSIQLEVTTKTGASLLEIFNSGQETFAIETPSSGSIESWFKTTQADALSGSTITLTQNAGVKITTPLTLEHLEIVNELKTPVHIKYVWVDLRTKQVQDDDLISEASVIPLKLK